MLTPKTVMIVSGTLFAIYAALWFSAAKLEKFFQQLLQRADLQIVLDSENKEETQTDFRLWFVGWWPHCSLSKFYQWSLDYPWAHVTALIVFMVFLFSGHAQLEITVDAMIDAEKVYTTEENGRIQVIETTVAEAKKLPMYHDSSDLRIIWGTVSAVQVLGGNLTRTCMQQANKIQVCTSAPSGLKIGDEVFLRFGNMKTRGRERVRDSWLISKKEADALVATGAFKIVLY